MNMQISSSAAQWKLFISSGQELRVEAEGALNIHTIDFEWE